MRSIILAAILVPAAWGALAEGPPPAVATIQSITLAGALGVLDAAQRQATALRAPSSLAVVDAAGNLVAFLQMDGARPAGIRLAIGEARSAARWREPTQSLENAVNGGRPAAGMAGATALQGGVPLTVGAAVVGAVGVSGMDKDNDLRIAEAAAGSFR